MLIERVEPCCEENEDADPTTIDQWISTLEYFADSQWTSPDLRKRSQKLLQAIDDFDEAEKAVEEEFVYDETPPPPVDINARWTIERVNNMI